MTGHGATVESTLPRRTYDAAIYLCAANLDGCAGVTATADETETVHRALLRDRSVTSLAFASQDGAYRIAARVLTPAQLNGIAPEFLPATFFVSGPTVAELRSRYSTLPGVELVASCARNRICRVPVLRAAGIVH